MWVNSEFLEILGRSRFFQKNFEKILKLKINQRIIFNSQNGFFSRWSKILTFWNFFGQKWRKSWKWTKKKFWKNPKSQKNAKNLHPKRLFLTKNQVYWPKLVKMLFFNFFFEKKFWKILNAMATQGAKKCRFFSCFLCLKKCFLRI